MAIGIKEALIHDIVDTMSVVLSKDETVLLRGTLYTKMQSFEVEPIEALSLAKIEENIQVFEQYVQAKLSCGRFRDKTISAYRYAMQDFFNIMNKGYNQIGTDDIRNYLNEYSVNKDGTKKKRTTMNNRYHILNSFFTWCTDNNYIARNPMASIDMYRVKRQVKGIFSEEDITSIRDSCTNIRDRAIVDLLSSSLIRVGELVKLNIDDICFDNKTFVVYDGKGGSQRVARFNGQTKKHLLEYLETRTDDNEALFVSLYHDKRLGERGVESLLKKIGSDAGVQDVHPHKFRRTGATRMLRAGVPLDIIQQILGHQCIATTQIYARSNESMVEFHYRQVYND